jgi:NADH-quinone oxidoreductase subunit M
MYLLAFVFVLWYLLILVTSFCVNNGCLKARLIRQLSLFFSTLQFLFILVFWVLSGSANLTANFGVFNFQIFKQWVSLFNFYFIVGIDNISLVFLLLTFLLTPLCILISWNNIKYRYSSFVICLIFVTFILFSIFCTLDLVFFYFFFESILIPMFILIGVWGSRQRKIHAVYQLFFYTLIGSLFMLLGILTIYSHIQTTDVRILSNTNFSFYRQLFL